MQFKNYNVYFFMMALIGVSVLAFMLFKPFLGTIITAIALAIVFWKPYKFFLKITRNSEILSSILTCFLVLFSIVLPIVLALGLLANEANNIYENVLIEGDLYHESVSSTLLYLEQLPILELFDLSETFSQEELVNSLKDISQGFLTFIQKTYQNIASFILKIFVMFFTLFYVLIEGRNIVKKLMSMSPLRDDHEKLLVEKWMVHYIDIPIWIRIKGCKN